MSSHDEPTVIMEADRTGFNTEKEPHPSQLVDGGHINKEIGIRELREAIPDYCFTPNVLWSTFYVLKDITYALLLLYGLKYALSFPVIKENNLYYYIAVNVYGFCAGIVWVGIWILAHDAGHSGFSTSPTLNDTIGFVLHSFLLAPYFSWKSTHRRHHIYANHMEKDLNHVPLTKNAYAAKLGVALDKLADVGQDAPIVLTLRIILQQVIGWNWYIISNITCPNTSAIKPDLSVWRYSHFDPWGGMFRDSEKLAVLLSDIGCLTTLGVLYYLSHFAFAPMFWLYVVPWAWANHWVVMITFLHHTHPDLPKYPAESWTFIRGATATIDRNFGFIGSHFFHHISSDHVVHHLFSSIPHYYAPIATKAVKPLLAGHYHTGTFTYRDLETSFGDCQWVEEDAEKDKAYGLKKDVVVENEKEVMSEEVKETDLKNRALWYRKGRSPPPEFVRRPAILQRVGSEVKV